MSTGAVPAISHETLALTLAEHGFSEVAIELFDTLPSTSVYLAESARAEGTGPQAARLCATDWQTAGNGRRGKNWLTERGNITFSLMREVNKAPAQLLGLSLVTGIAIAETLREHAKLDVMLKWPNDIYVGDAKLCGMLTELAQLPERHSTRVIAGIGINYVANRYADSNGFKATCLQQLCAEPPERSSLIGTGAARVLAAYEEFLATGWQAFAERWAALDYLYGKDVTLYSAHGSENARAVGVDASGALLVSANGQTHPVYSGDVSVRPA